MSKQLPVELLEAVEILLLAIGSSAVSAIGLLLEGRALAAVSGGDLQMAAWFLFMGTVALFFGVYLLGVTELLPRLSELASRV